MTEIYPAFSISPVPQPSSDTPVPELFHGMYGMPAFVTVPTADLEASTRFWSEGLGFFDFFSAEGQFVHLRRWAFQDVLLVPGQPPAQTSTAAVSFACVENQLEEMAASCQRLLPGSASEPTVKPWNSAEVDVVTPENLSVTMTAARPFDPESQKAQNLKEIGIEKQ
ncbi:VOC family protein [Nesterenkonia sp. MY13]|uniref:VOC family protein n=1 Tax=Nesterenkonia sedimenti TaxID=1463632 RepID=A0A7X8TKT5_9MICC|nr:VOC family protein [Nesterenkonia sedimenti]NLS10187.1 VOC family protein [Nesterenkonia sedimenti]